MMRQLMVMAAVLLVTLLPASPIMAQVDTKIRMGMVVPSQRQASPVPTAGTVDHPVLSRTISVRVSNVPLGDVLGEISRRGDFDLSYSPDHVPLSLRVSVRLDRVTVGEALNEVLAGTGLTLWVARTGQIALVRPPAPPIDGTEQTEAAVLGRVVAAETGQPLAGASIRLEGTRLATTTGQNGRYRLGRVPAGEHTIVATMIGYGSASRRVVAGAEDILGVDFELEYSPIGLDELTVTGSIVELRRRELASPITVITQEEIARRNLPNINQLLVGTVPGLVSWTAPGRPSSPIEVRGKNSFESNYLKTYIDGVEVANPLYLGNLDPASVERIEILRGPQASTIYGSDAAGGVIQIFTRRGAVGMERPVVRAKVSGGFVESQWAESAVSHQDHTLSVTGSVGDGMSYHVGGSYREMGEWVEDLTTDVRSFYGSTRVEQGSLIVDASARHTQFGFALFRPPHLIEFPPFANPLNRVIENTGETFGVQATYTMGPRWQHRVTAGIDRNAQETRQTAPVGAFPGDTLLELSVFDHVKRSFGYNTTVQLPLGDVVSSTVTAGFDHWNLRRESWSISQASLQPTNEGGESYRSANANRTTGAARSNTGYFGQLHLGWRDAVFVTAGLRAEDNVNFGPEYGLAWAPRIGAAYARDIGETTLKLRAGYGESSRPPSPVHSRDSGVPGSAQYTIANPVIGPEREVGTDAGIELYFGRRASLEMTVYHQTSVDLISRVPLQPTAEIPIINQWQNVGEITNRGIELQGTVNFDQLRIGGTLSFLSSRVGDLAEGYTGALEPGDRMLGVPGHVAGINAVYTAFGTTIGVDVTHVGSWTNNDQIAFIAAAFGAEPPRPTARDYWMAYPDFTKVDLTVSRRVFDRFNAFAIVNDLTDRNPLENNNLEVSHGRRTILGLEVTF